MQRARKNVSDKWWQNLPSAEHAYGSLVFPNVIGERFIDDIDERNALRFNLKRYKDQFRIEHREALEHDLVQVERRIADKRKIKPVSKK